MNLLIAYDGSQSAEAAIGDLANAGLPPVSEAVVVYVGEVWTPGAPWVSQWPKASCCRSRTPAGR